MSIMKAVLIAAFGLLLLAPTACLAGVLDHFCSSCPETSCGHEPGCLADPCNTTDITVVDSRCKGDRPLEAAPGVPLPPEFGEMVAPAHDAAPGPVAPRVALPQMLPAAFPPLRC